MYGYIYQTTNLINGKVYIGQHMSESFDANYYGSGKWLKRAIAKYGIETSVLLCYHGISLQKNLMLLKYLQ